MTLVTERVPDQDGIAGLTSKSTVQTAVASTSVRLLHPMLAIITNASFVHGVSL